MQADAWVLPDDAFFARHASHILAFVFKQLHQGEGRYWIRHVRPKADDVGNFVYATDGEWAFCAVGWIPEADLLDELTAAHWVDDPSWDFDLINVPDGLEEFCARSYVRPPAYFLHLPWERTYKFISQFEEGPPGEDEPDETSPPSSLAS